MFICCEVLAGFVCAACVPCTRGVGMRFRRLMRGCLRPGYNDSDVVEQTDFRQLSNGILVFRLGELKRMSETRKSREVAAHNVTHEKEYAEVVRVA